MIRPSNPAHGRPRATEQASRPGAALEQVFQGARFGLSRNPSGLSRCGRPIRTTATFPRRIVLCGKKRRQTADDDDTVELNRMSEWATVEKRLYFTKEVTHGQRGKQRLRRVSSGLRRRELSCRRMLVGMLVLLLVLLLGSVADRRRRQNHFSRNRTGRTSLVLTGEGSVDSSHLTQGRQAGLSHALSTQLDPAGIVRERIHRRADRPWSKKRTAKQAMKTKRAGSPRLT